MLQNEEPAPCRRAQRMRGVCFLQEIWAGFRGASSSHSLPTRTAFLPEFLAAFTAGKNPCRMESHTLWLVQLFLFALWVNGLMTIGLAGAQQRVVCNESLMLQKLPVCGKSFEEMMHKVDSQKWCNLTEFILTVCPFQTWIFYSGDSKMLAPKELFSDRALAGIAATPITLPSGAGHCFNSASSLLYCGFYFEYLQKLAFAIVGSGVTFEVVKGGVPSVFA
ncbi:uncharacterized protein LOC125440607 [Sphaerodactylus townsendi]|uniref:uncharacterized protein LOC125440607 n=1 Tax=Sphaerodactylus townsendi TaxID=933632 RepID=UPI0020264AEB|nr:uncharacterized protein LOC125440607 [Sphaerodactylus townsendi]